MHIALARYRAADNEHDLIVRYAPAIERTARKLVARTGIASLYDDLWSAGAMGLIDAAGRFDEARDVSFDGFVEHRIRGAMLDELRRHDHLPRRMRAETQRVARVRAELSKALGRVPQDEELAQAAETTLEHLHELEAVASPPAPLDPEMLLRDVSQGSDERIERRQVAASLAKAVGQLTERLQLILSLHYVEDLTYREIADVLKLSQPRISQLHSEALGLLRSALAEEGVGQRS